MAEIINLNKARKIRDKAAKEEQAIQNRVSFGQKKSDKAATKGENLKQSRKLDRHKLEDD